MSEIELRNEFSDEDYNQLDGWRSSDLKGLQTIDGCEAEFVNRHVLPKRDTTTTALDFGTSFHRLVILGERDFHLAKHDGRTTAGKTERKEAERRGLRLVTSSEYERLTQCHSASINLLQRCGYSIPFKYRELALEAEIGGLRVKAKLDMADVDVVDLKSISRWPHEGRFLGQIDKYSYDISACHYLKVAELNGLKFERYRWLFQESCWPYRARMVTAPEWLIENTWHRLDECYERARTIDSFESPTEVDLQPEEWWLFSNKKHSALEGVEDYEE